MRKSMKAAVLAIFLVALPALGQEPPRVPQESATGMMFRPSHIAFRVADLEESVQWWRDIFGAREVRRSRVPDIDPDIHIVYMHISSGFNVELVGGGTPVPIERPSTIVDDLGRAGYKHVAFNVSNMDAALAHMKRYGVEAERRSTRPDYGIELAIIREPGGQFIELYAPLSTN